MELISTVAAAYLVIFGGGPSGDVKVLKIPMKSMEACEQHLVMDQDKWTIGALGFAAPLGDFSLAYRCFRTDVK